VIKMLTVFKYPAVMNDEFSIRMPYDSKILKAENQHGQLCLWVLVNTECQEENRTFLLTGTGHAISYEMSEIDFISTFQMRGGSFVFHVFEIKK